MKKLISILITVLLFTGCTNIFKDETTVTIKIAESSRDLASDLSNAGYQISKIELLIVDPSVVENDSYFGFYTYNEGTYTIDTTDILDPDSDVDFDENTVRYLQNSSNQIAFNIQIGVTKLFAVKVTYTNSLDDTTRVFTGGAEYTIYPHTETLDFEVRESAFSSANQDFIQWDEEVDSNDNL